MDDQDTFKHTETSSVCGMLNFVTCHEVRFSFWIMVLYCRYVSRALRHTVGTIRLYGRRQSPDIVCHELGNNYSSTPSRESFLNDPFLMGQRMCFEMSREGCANGFTLFPHPRQRVTLCSHSIISYWMMSSEIFLLSRVTRWVRCATVSTERALQPSIFPSHVAKRTKRSTRSVPVEVVAIAAVIH